MARRFLRVYLRDRSHPVVHPRRWRHRIRPLVTPTLWQGLRHTDPTAVPHGPARLRVTASGSFGALLHARLPGGHTLQVSMVAYDGRWRVADVEPAR